LPVLLLWITVHVFEGVAPTVATATPNPDTINVIARIAFATRCSFISFAFPISAWRDALPRLLTTS
jgi:hypothetical protein